MFIVLYTGMIFKQCCLRVREFERASSHTNILCFQNPWKIEKFHGFSLPLPTSRTDRVALRDLIDNYLRTVIVHEVECGTCTRRNGKKTKSSFSKLTAVARVSRSPVVILKK